MEDARGWTVTFYLAGNAGGQPFSVHAEGERVILRHGEEERKEIDLVAPRGAPQELPEPLCPQGSPSLGDPEAEHEEVQPPGASGLDQGLQELQDERGETGGEG